MYFTRNYCTSVTHSGIHMLLYTVSQKNIPDIFDCNLKTNYPVSYTHLTLPTNREV